MRGGDSLSSEAMAVEDAGPAKAEEQDRLKALDASIANLEKARGGKPDVAIDEVLRQTTKALLKAAIAAREKAVMKLEGLQKEEMGLTQLLLLEQQDISDAKSEAAEKAREVGTLQARRLAEVDCDGSVSHVSSSASCSAPLSPQQWALGLAPSLSEDVRVKFEEWYNSVEIEAKASVDPYSEVPSQGSPATSLPADPVSSTPIAATSTGSAFRAAKANFTSQRAAPYAVGFQMSKSQERSPGADQFVNAVAGCRRLSGSPSPGSARVTAGPAEQDSELCTMADFSRRVPLDELRGRGRHGKTSWEIPGHFTCWSQSLVFSRLRATPRLGSSSSVCVTGLTARATKLKFRRGGVVPPHSSGAHVRSLYGSWCYAMPMRG